MKYRKPDVHIIFVEKIHSQCVDGSGAAFDNSCNEGSDISSPGPRCDNGAVADTYCNIGSSASSCVNNGIGVGLNCFFGDGAS